MRKWILFSCVFFIPFVFALPEGSERFVQFREGTSDFGVLVEMARNPRISNNLFFTDSQFVNGIAEMQFPNGSGQKYVAANALNYEGNYVMAAAKTDPRSSGFITNSMDKMLADPQFEMKIGEGLNESKLAAAQAGENASRYIVPEIITPDVGFYQTTDNEQSYESAYDNVLLGKAEEALFEGDQADAIAYFDQKSADFKNSDNKQTEASSYQKDGLMRSKKTAETFRDFFQMKASISQQNLNLMPTTSSLLSRCQSNTPKGEDLYGIYKKAMPREEVGFYGFKAPAYQFDFCEQYVADEGDFLVRNVPVQNQLKTLVEDSVEMAQGLDEISKTLSDQSLSVQEITGILMKNPAWKTLSLRGKAYRECKKTKCLDRAAEALGSVVDYPGANNHKSKERLEIRNIINDVISNKSMTGEGQSGSLLANLPKLKSSKFKNGAKKKKTKEKSWLISSDDLSPDQKKKVGRSIASQKDDKVYYSGKRFPRAGGYFRGEDGVLRGPSGKPVQGYHNSESLDLFKIISRRYLLKYSKKQFE